MIELVTTIEDVFAIEGRGCVVCPGIPLDAEIAFHIGDHLSVVDSGSCVFDSIIRGIEMISGPKRRGLPILLPKSIHKKDIPIGSQLVLISGSPRDGDQSKTAFSVGDRVSVRLGARNSTPHTGTVESVDWHHKYRLWYYRLRSDTGRAISKRYTAADLVGTADGG